MPIRSNSPDFTVKSHFENRDANVREIYDRLLRGSKKFGRVIEEPKKTSIHLVRKTAFAAVATRKTALILTLKLDAGPKSARIRKREQTSAHRWHVEVMLESPAQVDQELKGWLERAYELSA